MKTDEELEEEAIRDAQKVWGGQVVLPYVHCTICPPDQIKQRCVVDMIEGTAVCARHWIERRLAELKAQNKPKLDTDDFAKI